MNRVINQLPHVHTHSLLLRARQLHSRRSQMFIPTLKQVPTEAAVPSHQLLLRAGYMRKSSQGIYVLLPLALRSLTKLEQLIDHQMQQIGCSKTQMPSLLSADLWKKTNRWDTTGPELIRVTDRREDEYCLAPTHEELITQVAAQSIHSYRQLPLRLYQTGRKFRDEIRPRFGLMRSKEFIMKDAYSFDRTVDEAEETYKLFEKAYHNLFQQLKVPYVQVEADSGNIGGSLSHEYHILSKHGEDTILSCSSCGYAANNEKATGRIVETSHTADSTSYEELDRSLVDWILDENLSTAIYSNPERTEVAVAFARSDREINDIAVKAAKSDDLERIEASRVVRFLKDLDNETKKHIFIDHSLSTPCNNSSKLAEVLASSLTQIGINPVWGDFRLSRNGDGCPQCSSTLEEQKGIEVGHIFYLGEKYSKALDATFVTQDSTQETMKMGCYGLGVTRILAAMIECDHDDKGIKWCDETIAPFRIAVVSLGNKAGDDMFARTARQIAEDLDANAQGCKDDVLLDDRWEERPGSKLTEAELVGYPYVVVVGRSLKRDGTVEVQNRQTGERAQVLPQNLIEFFNKN